MLTEAERAALRSVDRLLGRVARRLRRRRALLAAFAGLGGAGLATAVAVVVARVGGGDVGVAWAGAMLGAVLGVAATAYAWPVARGAVALRVEGTYGPDAPCTATREVAGRGAINRVERALLATAPAWTARVDARVVVPPARLARWSWSLIPAWSAVALAAVLPWSWLAPPDATGVGAAAHAPGGLWLVEEDEAAVKLERFADLLYREAAARDDAAVRALAERAEALGERLRRGDLAAAAASAEFEALVGAVADALGYADDPTYRAGDGVGDDAVGAGARPATNRERAAETFGQDRREDIGTTRAPQEGERVLDSLLERLETEAIARSTAAPDADLSEVQFRPGVGTTDAGDAFESPYDDPNAAAPLDGTPTNDAARPDAGGAAVGDAAGMGGAEAGRLAQDPTTGGDPKRALDALEVELEAVALPDRSPPGARRLRVLAPPPSATATAPEDGPVGPPPPWAWREEAFLGGYAVDPVDRRLLAASFRPHGERTHE